nr:hypothetical protein [Pandoravirus aubagnensis]
MPFCAIVVSAFAKNKKKEFVGHIFEFPLFFVHPFFSFSLALFRCDNRNGCVKGAPKRRPPTARSGNRLGGHAADSEATVCLWFWLGGVRRHKETRGTMTATMTKQIMTARAH